uniref:Uncharacterized protein n=1 Tax=Arundo donax TaxID=35708 RepID=A0A0A9DSF2_ARUDO
MPAIRFGMAPTCSYQQCLPLPSLFSPERNMVSLRAHRHN